jgi:hypothetical protein
MLPGSLFRPQQVWQGQKKETFQRRKMVQKKLVSLRKKGDVLDGAHMEKESGFFRESRVFTHVGERGTAAAPPERSYALQRSGRFGC